MSAKLPKMEEAESLLNDRQANILMAVIREYVTTADPVGSQTIVDRYRFAVSPATVRNDMAALEEKGYLVSPHTSAGRVPTEAGYRYYIKHFLKERAVAKAEEQEVQSILGTMDEVGDRLKRTAKAVAGHSAESVFLSFGKNDIFYTGLTNLFRQPEFQEHLQLAHIGAILDRLDEVIASVYEQLPNDVAILVGRENPFGEGFTVIVSRYQTPSATGLFGMLGPTRMDYDANVARVKLVNEYITELL